MQVQTGAPWAPETGDKLLYLAGASTQLQPGDLFLVVGDERAKNSLASKNWDIRILATVTPDGQNDRTLITWDEGLGSVSVLPAQINPKFYAFRQRAAAGAPKEQLLVTRAAETVQFSRNEVDNCTAGLWVLSPLQASTIPFDPNNLALAGLAIAMGYPLPQGDTTATAPATQKMVTVPAAPASVRIYAGSANPYTDSRGNQWLPDVTESAAFSFGGGSLSSGDFHIDCGSDAIVVRSGPLSV